jgi:hypothetical protein
MKLDVEGEEYALFPGLVVSGALCDLDMLFLEAHREEFRSADGVNMTIPDMERLFDQMRKGNSHCKVNVTDLDDETYLDGKAIPLPEWRQQQHGSSSNGG